MLDAWISEALTEEATKLCEEEADPRTGRAQSILRVQGHHPDVARAHRELYRALMFEPRRRGGLSRLEREAVAVWVSAENHCHY